MHPYHWCYSRCSGRSVCTQLVHRPSRPVLCAVPTPEEGESAGQLVTVTTPCSSIVHREHSLHTLTLVPTFRIDSTKPMGIVRWRSSEKTISSGLCDAREKHSRIGSPTDWCRRGPHSTGTAVQATIQFTWIVSTPACMEGLLVNGPVSVISFSMCLSIGGKQQQ